VAGVVNFSGSVDGQGAEARFASPNGMARDANGNLFVADSDNFTLRKITPGGVVTTLAGFPGRQGRDDGVGSAARFTRPTSVVVRPDGFILVADDSSIRLVSPAGEVTTNGLGAILSQYRYLGGAVFTFQGIAGDEQGNSYASVKFFNGLQAGIHLIKDGSDGGRDYFLAGPAACEPAAGLEGKKFAGVAVDRQGNAYVGTECKGLVFKVTPGGEVTQAHGLDASLASDSAGNIYSLVGKDLVKLDATGSVSVIGTVANTDVGLVVDGTGSVFVSGGVAAPRVYKLSRPR